MTPEQLNALPELLAKATPGPWEYNDNMPRSYGTAWVNAGTVSEVAVCNGNKFGDHGFCYIMDRGENEANAALIALAPDLAAEVIRLRDAASQTPDPAVNALGAEWMRREAVNVAAEWFGYGDPVVLGIENIPNPTSDQLLAQAMRLGPVRAIVDALHHEVGRSRRHLAESTLAALAALPKGGQP